MVEFNKSADTFTKQQRGRGSRHSSGGNVRFLPRPPSPPTPPHREFELPANSGPQFTEAELARAAIRHFPDDHLQQDLLPQLQGRLLELSQQRVFHTRVAWAAWCRRYFMQGDRRYTRVWVFALAVAAAFFVLLLVMHLLHSGRHSPSKDMSVR